MSSTSSADPPLEGVCKLLPEPSDRLLEVVTREYAALADEYGPRNVLVLKRHPAGVETVRTALAAVDAVAGSPRVESLPEHASKAIEEYDPTLDRLEYEERIELISLVIDGASRDVPAYLERASDHESFGRDVGQLLLEATRQGLELNDLEGDGRTSGDTDSAVPRECLAFLYAMNDRFHEAVADRGYLERADVIPRAVELFEEDADGLCDRVTASFDAVLAIEFEEYRRLDRRYLGAVSDDAALVCLGERHASVERTRVEPGRIETVVGDGLEIKSLEPADVTDGETADSSGSPHRAITRFLATGSGPRDHSTTESDDADGRARRIRTRTAREQAGAVATEIQSLRDRHGWDHDAFAVAVPSVERVPETRCRLRTAGIPTATIGTPSLASDPAVIELYTVVVLQCARRRSGSDDPPSDRDATDEYEDELDRLRARVPEFAPDLLEACAGASVTRSIERWIRRTNLKGRIAATEDWVDAREQYAGIRRVLEIARFVEETDLVGPDWDGLRRMLERTITYDAPYVHAVETQPPTGGVAVCSIGDLSYDSRRAVFVLDLLDDVYPGEQYLTQLFPTAWLRELPSYPAVTDPSPATVAETFAPVDDPDAVGDPFATYHAQRARRRLARGSRVATDALYWCSYERDTGGLRRTYDESRYPKYVEATPGLTLEDVDTQADAAIHGDANAIEAILEQPRGELERVLREASTGGQADLADTETLFEEIAVVLEDDDIDDDLVEAVRSQFEFAAGEVIRDA